jgi:hypothetical protein
MLKSIQEHQQQHQKQKRQQELEQEPTLIMLCLPLQQLQSLHAPPVLLSLLPSSLAVSLQHQFFFSLLFFPFSSFQMTQCEIEFHDGAVAAMSSGCNCAAWKSWRLCHAFCSSPSLPGYLFQSGLHSCQQQGLGVSWLGAQNGHQMPDATLVARFQSLSQSKGPCL